MYNALKNKYMKKITVIGSSNMDLVVTTQDFPTPGQTVMGTGFMTNFGGKGANQAVAAARLGGDVAFISRVGDDNYGHEMRSHFEKEGINISSVLTTSDVPTGTALITVNKHGENCIVVVGGANTRLSTEDIEQCSQAIEDADIVLMQLEVPVEALVRAAQLAKAKGKYVVLNPAPAPQNTLPAELLSCIDLIIPNETEVYQLTGIEITDDASALEAIQKLQGLGIRDAMITIGSRGVIIKDEGEARRIPACKVVPLDTTAAGDTFCGALCVALAQGMPRHEAVLFANRAASYTVQHRGAQCAMPYLKDIFA